MPQDSAWVLVESWPERSQATRRIDPTNSRAAWSTLDRLAVDPSPCAICLTGSVARPCLSTTILLNFACTPMAAGHCVRGTAADCTNAP